MIDVTAKKRKEMVFVTRFDANGSDQQMLEMIRKHASECDLTKVDSVVITNMNRVTEKVYKMWDHMVKVFA